MPVYGKSDALAEGLGAMSQVVEGYIRGEEIAHQRAIEEREYAFRQEQFEETTRRYDRSLEEQMFEFDTELSFRAEQAALGREEARFLLEDEQAEAREAARVLRVSIIEESEKERTFRAEESRRERGVEYTRMKHVKDAQEAARRHEFATNDLYQLLNYLDGSPNFHSMADEYIVGIGGGLKGNRYPPSEILNKPGALRQELYMISMDPGARTFIGDTVTSEMAAEYVKMIDKAPGSEAELAKSLKAKGIIKTEPNNHKQAGLQNLAFQTSGVATPADYQALSPAQKDHWEQVVIRKLEGIDGMQRRQAQQELQMKIDEKAIELGTFAYGGSPYSAEGADNANYWVWDTGQNRPIVTGKGGEKVKAETELMWSYARALSTLTEDYANQEDWKDGRLKDEQDSIRAHMKASANRIDGYMMEEGASPRGMDLMNSYVAIGTGGPVNPGQWRHDINQTEPSRTPVARDIQPEAAVTGEQPPVPGSSNYAKELEAFNIRKEAREQTEKTAKREQVAEKAEDIKTRGELLDLQTKKGAQTIVVQHQLSTMLKYGNVWRDSSTGMSRERPITRQDMADFKSVGAEMTAAAGKQRATRISLNPFGIDVRGMEPEDITYKHIVAEVNRRRMLEETRLDVAYVPDPGI